MFRAWTFDIARWVNLNFEYVVVWQLKLNRWLETIVVTQLHMDQLTYDYICFYQGSVQHLYFDSCLHNSKYVFCQFYKNLARNISCYYTICIPNIHPTKCYLVIPYQKSIVMQTCMTYTWLQSPNRLWDQLAIYMSRFSSTTVFKLYFIIIACVFKLIENWNWNKLNSLNLNIAFYTYIDVCFIKISGIISHNNMKFICDNSFCPADWIQFVEHKLMQQSNMCIISVFSNIIVRVYFTFIYALSFQTIIQSIVQSDNLDFIRNQNASLIRMFDMFSLYLYIQIFNN